MYAILSAFAMLAGAVTTSGLGSAKFHERERAYDRLAAAIPWSLPAVFAATQSSDAETAWRAKRLIRASCPELDLWRCLLAPGVWRVMTCDEQPDAGEPDVPSLWRANNLIVPGQQCWTSPEMEIRWVWGQCKALRQSKPVTASPYFWNQLP